MSLSQQQTTPTENEINETAYNFITHKWSRTIIQPILIAIMVTALFTAILTVITAFSPNPEWFLLLPLFFVIILEGVYTSKWLSHPERRTLNHTYYLLSELLLILLVTRIYTWAIGNYWPQPQHLADYLRYPWLLFDDGLFLLGATMLIVAWLWGRTLSRTFSELALDKAEVLYYSKPSTKRDHGNLPVLQNRHHLTEQFYTHWVWGGIFVIICVSMVSIDLQNILYENIQIGLSQLRLPPMIIVAVLLYFLSGLALLSEARLETLNARWLHDGAQKAPAIEKKWHQFGIWFLILVGTAASFLPLGSTFLIGRLLEKIILAMTLLFSILSYLLILLYSLILTFLMTDNSPPPEATPYPTLAPTAAPQATPVPTVPPIVDDTPALVISSLFWTILLVGIVFAVLYFIRGRGVKIDGRIFHALLISIRHFFADLFGNVVEQIEELGGAIQTRLRSGKEDEESDVEKGKRPFRFFRINGLSPEEQVRYFYLSTVKRAQDKGVQRDKNETPLEFMDDLKESWPEAEEEIDALTDAFLQARYSPQPIAKEEVNPIKEKWKQAKSRLRKRAHKPES